MRRRSSGVSTNAVCMDRLCHSPPQELCGYRAVHELCFRIADSLRLYLPRIDNDNFALHMYEWSNAGQSRKS